MAGANATQQALTAVGTTGLHWTINFTGPGGVPASPDSPPTFKLFKDGVLIDTRVASSSEVSYEQHYENLQPGLYRGDVVFMIGTFEFVHPSNGVTLGGGGGTGTPTPTTGGSGGDNTMLWLIGGAAAILIVGAVVFFNKGNNKIL